MISQKLLDIIACPECKGPVQLTEAQDSLACLACKLAYEIRDGIPIMLIEEAKPLLPRA
ncbi:Trm112 family protein [Desulfobulbus sp. F4]|nr:Trm112 family protein [Desulfobulbus sp. F4]